MPISAAEQYLIELINRGRLDPLAEAERYDLDLNAGLAPGTIQNVPLQVLAPNVELTAAADAHSQWMLDTNTFSHTGVNASTPGARMEAAGFVFEGRWAWSENLAWSGSTGAIDMAAAITVHHEGLYRSAGHRVNTFGTDVREIGVGQMIGTFDLEGTSYNSSMLTEQFALSDDTVFITGVTYTDTDEDGFYSIGEGESDFWFRSGHVTAETAEAGGYALGVEAGGNTTVQIGQGGIVLGQIDLDTSAGNIKVDVITRAGGDQVLAVSGHATLGDGFDDALALGAADLNLTGNDAANILTGNHGNNVLSGGAGADRLVGGAGSDRLYGGDTGDRLFGGGGRDVLLGGAGYDRLYGGAYHDRLYGGSGNDRLYGGDGNDRMIGGNGHDRLYAGNGHDRLFGGNGRDFVSGGGGNDRIIGGNSDDRLYGNNGHDRLYGNSGTDRLVGGNGNDHLNGGRGNDVMFGGNGNDQFVFSGGKDRIADFEDDIDTIMISSAMANGASVAELIADADIIGGNIVLNLTGGNTLTVDDVTDASSLANDLIIL